MYNLPCTWNFSSLVFMNYVLHNELEGCMVIQRELVQDKAGLRGKTRTNSGENSQGDRDASDCKCAHAALQAHCTPLLQAKAEVAPQEHTTYLQADLRLFCILIYFHLRKYRFYSDNKQEVDCLCPYLEMSFA